MNNLEKIHYINCINASAVFQNDFPDLFRKNVISDIFKFPFIAFWCLISNFKPHQWFPKRDKVVFFFQTRNNYNSIKSVQKLTPNSILLHTNARRWSRGYLFPTGIAYLIAIPFLPVALFHMTKSRGREKKAFYAFFNKYWRTYGLIVAYNLYLRILKPRALVLTNDHSRDPLIISLVCRKKNIPVFLIPHGSYSGETINENPMHIDFALVSGEHQKRRIERAMPLTKVKIIGRPLSDGSIAKLNRSKSLKKLGICINEMDSMSEIGCLIDLLKSKTDLTITIRPHPDLVESNRLQEIYKKNDLLISNPLNEKPIQFLEKVDAIVSGCSGIILDAAEMNVYPIFFDSSRRYSDFNNFVENKLARVACSKEECLGILNELVNIKPSVRHFAAHYNGIIGTAYDGRSSQLAKKYILENI